MIDKPKPLDLEELAELEHKQWMEWSKVIWSRLNSMKDTLDEAMDVNSVIREINHIGERWKKEWIDYKLLSEKQKEQDRIWARKVLQRIKSACEFYSQYKDNQDEFEAEQEELIKREKVELYRDPAIVIDENGNIVQ